MSKKDKGRLPPFVPLLISTLNSPAWREMSHGAQMLYVALKRRVPKGRNRAYVSYRQAILELRSSKRKIAEWFREVQQFGFIVLAQHGSIGVEGKGKAPHWRLTELGQTSGSSATSLPEVETKDFLRWDGTPFKRRQGKQNPGSYVGYTPVPTWEPTAVPTGDTPKPESGSNGVDIGAYGVDITSLTTSGGLGVLTSELDPELQQTNFGPSVVEDERIVSLQKWGRAAELKTWTKPTILFDEPRDFTLYPTEEKVAAA